MINFIIYEDNDAYRKKYISVIIKFMGNNQSNYKITEISEYNSKLKETMKSSGKKIYILDIEVPKKSGLDLAREIRDSGDWNSQIIIVTSHDSLQQTTFTSRLLTLDFISKLDNLLVNLKKSLLTSYIILTNDKSLKFQYNGEFYQFYYNDILYIKKDPKDLDIEIVLSDNSKKLIHSQMGQIEEMLKDDFRFFRTHRGCIVNMTKIKSVDFNTGTISFGKSKIDLLSRENKKKFKDTLNENYIEYKEIKNR